MEIKDAVCLVTGASAGIGEMTAIRLAQSGAQVLLHGRDEKRLSDIAEKTGGTPIAVDLADDEGPQKLCHEALAAAGQVDIVINNAGIGWSGDFATMSEDVLARLIKINLTAPLILAKLLLPGMRERGQGHISMVSSIAAVGVQREAVYSATKAGLTIFSESLRQELLGTGVTVSVIAPGPVKTEFFARRGTPYAYRFPRPVSADQVARAIVRAITRDSAEVFVPGWLRPAARLHGALPALFGKAAARMG